MSPDPTLAFERTFLSVCGELGFLSPADIVELAAAAKDKNASPATLALQRGLLDGAQLDIVETLLHPRDAIPGYEILGLLGRGGMGVVYRARQLSLARVVALKTVLVSELGHEAAIPRFEQEARAVARLGHPHIIAAYDFGTHHGRVYFAMELVPGEDVEHLVERTGPLDEYTAWGLARQAASGLAHAAEQGIVHRDIKPANMLLLDRPAGFDLPPGLPLLKIADFGLARLSSASTQAHLTTTNVAVGSPRYMAPEQFRGATADLRADIFSLGASVFHMLTGRPPLGDKSLAQIVAARLDGEMELARKFSPTVSPQSDELIAAMTATDPERRIGSYRELIERIDALRPYSRRESQTHLQVTQRAALGNATTRTGTEPTQPVTTRPKSRRLYGWLVGAMTVLLVALVAAPYLIPRPFVGERDLVPTGRSVELFNGKNVAGWSIFSGGWAPARNDEGAMVLQGNGLIRLPKLTASPSGPSAPMKSYRLTYAVNLHEATNASLNFDVDAETESSRRHNWCLHIDHETSTVVEGINDLNYSERVVAGPMRHSQWAGSNHAVRLERHSRSWWVFVDEQLLGSVPILNGSQVDTGMSFAVEGGNAWFSDITLEELGPPPAAP